MNQSTFYLWNESYKRNAYKSTFVHENVMRIMKSYLLTYIVNDAIKKHSTEWSKRRKTWLSFTMKTAWCEMKNRLKKKHDVANNDVTSKSHMHEIKKINRKSKFLMWLIDVSQFYDEISDWRSKVMKTIKSLVQSFFFSNQCNNVDEIKKRCDKFLTKDRFICLQICSTIQINLFQNSTNRVDVHWIFVDV